MDHGAHGEANEHGQRSLNAGLIYVLMLRRGNRESSRVHVTTHALSKAR